MIDYSAADFTRTGARWDVVLDNVGNRSVSDLRRALVPGGTLIPSANSGARWLGAARRAAHSLVLSPFVRQRLRPFVARADAAKALDYYAQGHARGKVVLTVG